MSDFFNSKPPPRPPYFEPSERDAPHTFNREFADNQQALDWLGIQGRTFPRLFLCLAAMRKNAGEVVTRIEADLYPWGTAANEDFHYIMMLWEEVGLVVISVPRADEGRVISLLERVPPGFRLSYGEPHIYQEPGTNRIHLATWREGGTRPTDIEAPRAWPGSKCFPIKGENVVTIESLNREPGPTVTFYHMKVKPNPKKKGKG